MAYITYRNISGECPFYKTEICVSGIYVIDEETSTEKLVRTECPITKQLKLPYNRRALFYRKISPCDRERDCPLIKELPLEIEM